ncbi:hypothetical protein [Engelhardtia mirabilis]|uniref:FG-GAP repeat protein n=1 Tax=Engelhardtia mirabilis TaxID=2528011 RepID=A0A518BEK3_9BACT|nr:hypothetical protein Pla133_03780 [Planctomycetes bacterium Pla133]QDU99639.1 hypothetical protein Pla86_03780 [Planctomycetes bacterium Pla86]
MRTALALTVSLAAAAPLAAAQDYAINSFLNPAGELGENFGRRVGLSGTTAIGASFNGAWIIDRTASGKWKVGDLLTPLDPHSPSCFGASVAIDGDRAVVSDYCESLTGFQSGSVYVFERGPGGSWSQTAKLFVPGAASQPAFGWDLDLEGNRLAVGAPNGQSPFSSALSGVVHVFELLPDGNWVLDATIAPQTHWDNMDFGESVALSGDRLLVGAPSFINHDHDAHLEIFDRNAAGQWVAKAVLTPPGVQEYDWTGRAVALEGDTAVAGAALHDAISINDGVVWVWERQAGGVWKLAQALVTPGSPVDSHAGISLALDGDRMLVGARGETVDGVVKAGAAHLWKRNSNGIWNWQERIVSPAPEDTAYAGTDVALGNGWVLLGVPNFGPGYDGRIDVTYSFAAGDVPPTENFGAGTAGCASAHSTFLPLPPLIGSGDFRVLTAGSPPLAPGLLVIGSSGDPLGSDKFALGCDLHVDVLGSSVLLVLSAFSDGQGQGKATIPIPGDPVLIGLQLFAQTVWIGPACPALPYGLSSSDGLAFVIGAP